MELKGKRAVVLVEDMYQEMEVWYPVYRLREAGCTVTIAGTGRKEYKSKLGYPCTADADVKELKAADFDAVVIPGGYAPDILRRYDAVNTFVADAFKAGQVVAAICHGPWVAVSAGILKGRTATCFSAIKDDVINAGAKYVDQEVCVDKNLITSRMPGDLPAFMRETLNAMKGK